MKISNTQLRLVVQQCIASKLNAERARDCCERKHPKLPMHGYPDVDFFLFLLIIPHCFKHNDRIQQTNMRPGNKTTGFRYWIETSVKKKES